MSDLECTSCAKSRLANITEAKLEQYLGKSVEGFCDTGYVNLGESHCAHFVSHVLELRIGLICGSMKSETKGRGASIRVNEVFNSCQYTGLWSSRPLDLSPCLCFATPTTNFRDGQMQSGQKHVGIYCNGMVYHYSNSQDKVIKDSPERFLIKFKGQYGSKTQTYYGAFNYEVL